MSREQASFIAKRCAEIFKNTFTSLDVHVIIPQSATQNPVDDIVFACVYFPSQSTAVGSPSINVIIHE